MFIYEFLEYSKSLMFDVKLQKIGEDSFCKCGTKLDIESGYVQVVTTDDGYDINTYNCPSCRRISFAYHPENYHELFERMECYKILKDCNDPYLLSSIKECLRVMISNFEEIHKIRDFCSSLIKQD